MGRCNPGGQRDPAPPVWDDSSQCSRTPGYEAFQPLWQRESAAPVFCLGQIEDSGLNGPPRGHLQRGPLSRPCPQEEDAQPCCLLPTEAAPRSRVFPRKPRTENVRSGLTEHVRQAPRVPPKAVFLARCARKLVVIKCAAFCQRISALQQVAVRRLERPPFFRKASRQCVCGCPRHGHARCSAVRALF